MALAERFRHGLGGPVTIAAAGDAVLAGPPFGPTLLVRSDPGGAWHTSFAPGGALYLDESAVLTADRAIVTDSSGTARELGWIDGVPQAVATDGRYLVTVTDDGTSVYRLTH